MKLATKAVLIFTLMMLLTGCFSSLYAPPRKALLQIESPPHRTTLLTDADDMTQEMVEMCMKVNNRVKYKDYKFNENFNISLNATGVQDIDRTNTDTTTVTSSREATVTDNRQQGE